MGARSFLYLCKGKGHSPVIRLYLCVWPAAISVVFGAILNLNPSSWQPTLTELLAKIAEERPAFCQLIVITGGEPFRQNIGPLVQDLLAQYLQVQIETNGTLWVDLPVSERLHIVCSPKTSRLNEKLVARIGSYKYIIAAGRPDEGDGLPAFEYAKRKCHRAYRQAGCRRRCLRFCPYTVMTLSPMKQTPSPALLQP